MAKKKKKRVLTDDILRDFKNPRNFKKMASRNWTEVDTSKLSPKVKKMMKVMEKNVIGQEQALGNVFRVFNKSMVRLRDKRIKKPLGVLVLDGPTGVGKTETAKSVAEVYVGEFAALTRIDCSEFSERHTIARLIGAPPGYVGYGDDPYLSQENIDAPFLEHKFPEFGGLNGELHRLRAEFREEKEYYSEKELKARAKEIKELLKEVREYRKKIKSVEIPSVILFDEIEKASPEVIKILLQIIDEGVTTTSQGMTCFENSIIILTGNIAARDYSDALAGKGTVGFSLENQSAEKLSDAKKKAEEGLEKFFPPELCSRIRSYDGVVIYNPLTEKDKADIARLKIGRFGEILWDQFSIRGGYPGNGVISHIVSQLVPKYGAREIERVLEKDFFNPIRQAIGSKELKKGDEILFYIEKGCPKFLKISSGKKKSSRKKTKGIRPAKKQAKPAKKAR